MTAASTGHVQSFFKLNFRCIEKKFTFYTIRKANVEDTVGNLINTVLDTNSIDCIKVLQQFNFKSIIVNLVKKENGTSDAKNPVNAFQILMTARRRYDQYPPLRYVI